MLVGYDRPENGNAHIGPAVSNASFPSGHTAVAFSMATILGESYDIKWLTYPVAALVGLSRIEQNAHWPSDLLAGAIIGHTEARSILERHGFLSDSSVAESHAWDRTRIDIDAAETKYYDSYVNLEGKTRASDGVGSLIWNGAWTRKFPMIRCSS